MHIKDVFYNKYYLPTVINRLRLKNKNHNKHFSLFTANCIGGYIYHQLNVNFLSPTINLMILQPDYLSLDFVEIKNTEGCPKGRLGDIVVNFTHYQNFSQAVSAWKRRSKRVDFDNLYIIATDRDGITDKDIESLGKVKCKKLVCFCSKKYDYPYCFFVEEFRGETCVGDIIKKTLAGKWKFEKFFDFVAWLNSDDLVAENFKRK